MATTGGGVPMLHGNISKELADKLKRRSGTDQQEQTSNSLIGGKATPPPIAKKPQGRSPIHPQKLPMQQNSPITNAKPTPPTIAKKPAGFNPMSAQRTPIRSFNNDISKELNAKLKIQSPSMTPTGGLKLPHQIMRQSSDHAKSSSIPKDSFRQEESVQCDKDGIPISNSPALNHSAARAKLRVMPKRSKKASKHLSLDMESIIDGMDAFDEGHQREFNFRAASSDQSEAKLQDRSSTTLGKEVNVCKKSRRNVDNSKSQAEEKADIAEIEMEDDEEYV